MRVGEMVAYRVRPPRDGDSGFRPAIVISKNGKGYTLAVHLDPDRDNENRQSACDWTLYARNAKEGDDVGSFMPYDGVNGLDGEKPKK